VTTLSGTQALNALTTAEAAQLCHDAYAYFAATIGAATTCKWNGLVYATSSSAPTDEALRQNCTNRETACLADPGALWAANADCDTIPTDCTSTVAEYSGCVRDAAAAFTLTVNGLPSCDAFTHESTNLVWNVVAAPPLPSCTFCAGLYPPTPMIL
jgi:hypothetical protein